MVLEGFVYSLFFISYGVSVFFFLSFLGSLASPASRCYSIRHLSPIVGWLALTSQVGSATNSSHRTSIRLQDSVLCTILRILGLQKQGVWISLGVIWVSLWIFGLGSSSGGHSFCLL